MSSADTTGEVSVSGKTVSSESQSQNGVEEPGARSENSSNITTDIKEEEEEEEEEEDDDEVQEIKPSQEDGSEDDNSSNPTESDAEELEPISYNIPNAVPSSILQQPIDSQFRKAVGLILDIKGYKCTDVFLDDIRELAVSYLSDLVSNLKKYTESQRRSRPSISDTRLCLQQRKIKPSELYAEHVKTKHLLTPQVNSMVHQLNDQASNVIREWMKTEIDLIEGDASLPFFMNEHYEITELVPKQSERPSYIPAFLPDLPPDYTYHKTAKYTNTISDMKELRLKLVEESELAEKSLYNLIEDSEAAWRKELEQKLDQNDSDSEDSDHDNSIMSDSHKDVADINREADTPAYDVEAEAKPEAHVHENENNESTNTPNAPSKSDSENHQAISAKPKNGPNFFDFVAYAQKRKIILEERERAKEKKRKLRASNIFMKAEKYYSPYATEKVTSEVSSFFKNSIEEELRETIQSLRKAESRKKKKIKAFLEKKAELQEQQKGEKDQFEFSFNFDNIDNAMDESDEDSDLDPPDNIEFASTSFSDQAGHENGTNGFQEHKDTHAEGAENTIFSKSISARSDNEDLESLSSDSMDQNSLHGQKDITEPPATPATAEKSPSSIVDIDEGDFEDI